MAIKYTVRVASPVAYEYWEAVADSYQELVQAESELQQHRAEQAGGPDAAEKQAVETLQKGGLVGGLPGLKKSAPAGGKWQPGKTEDFNGKVLGEHDGFTVRIQNGNYGWYFNAYNKDTKDRLNANFPKGLSPEQATLEIAVETLNERAAG